MKSIRCAGRGLTRRILATGMCCCVILAACGSGVAPPASSSPASVSASRASASASVTGSAAPFGASKPAGSSPTAASETTASATGGPIKIGLLAPLTGPVADAAKENIDGFNLYLESIGNTVAGRKIEVIPADDQFKADVGLTKAKELVESQKVHLLAGIFATPVCYAVATYVQQAKLPLVVTGQCGAQTMMTDPKFASSYLVRFTQNATVVTGPPADWAYKQGYRKAMLMLSDFGGGLETADGFASMFVKRGGSIVQEQYPAQGSTDFGPFLAKLNKDADFAYVFLPGVDGLRFMDQIRNYADISKLPIIDAYAAMTDGSNLDALKDKAVGIIQEGLYTSAADTPENQAFVKAWQAKYPGRYVSSSVAQGYAGAQIIAAALNKVNGKVEQTQDFLNALYATNVNTAKGPIKLDANHDVVESVYIDRVVKQGDRFGQQLLATYEDVSRSWERTPQEMENFPLGKLKGQWVGMTKEKLESLSAPAKR